MSYRDRIISQILQTIWPLYLKRCHRLDRRSQEGPSLQLLSLILGTIHRSFRTFVEQVSCPPAVVNV